MAMRRYRRRFVRVWKVVGAFIGFPLFIFSIPGLVDDATTWGKWISNLPDSVQWVMVIVGFGMIVSGPTIALTEWWLPRTEKRRRLRGMEPLIRAYLENMPWTEFGEGAMMPDRASRLSPWVDTVSALEQELHELSIPHRSLLTMDDGWHFFCDQLRKAALADDLGAAREAGKWWMDYGKARSKENDEQ